MYELKIANIVICIDTSFRSESTGRRSRLWRSCSSALQRSGNA